MTDCIHSRATLSSDSPDRWICVDCGASIPTEAVTWNNRLPLDPEYKLDPVEYKNDILAEREKSYGDPVLMHERIAEIWSGILGHEINANEVALCMIGLKLARSQNDPTHEDSLVDVAGYNEIAQMIQARKKESEDA